MQEAQRLERLRQEEQVAREKLLNKSPYDKFEPCLVCGDRASGERILIPSQKFYSMIFDI